MSRCRQSMASLAGATASSASTAVPMPPPVSTTDAVPRAATESTSLVTRRAATALASSCASRCTITSGTLTLCLRLAAGVLLGAAFPRRSFLAPQSRRRRAPSARSLSGTSGQRAKRLGVDLVGFEPAQFLGDQFGGLAPVQRHPAFRPAGPGQGGVPAVRPGQRDLPVRRVEADLGDPWTAGLAALYLDAKPQPEPGRDQVRGRVGRFG